MTIPKAIEILQKAVDNVPVIPSSSLHIAQRLGIEALKWRKELYELVLSLRHHCYRVRQRNREMQRNHYLKTPLFLFEWYRGQRHGMFYIRTLKGFRGL